MPQFRDEAGLTLIELLVVIGIISILAALTSHQIARFRSSYNVRSCATNLIQNMRMARAMAIKENREYLIVFDTANQRYLIGFDGDGDDDLITVTSDGFGTCGDTLITDTDNDGTNDRGNGTPDTDTDLTPVDGVSDCVKVFSVSQCGNGITYGTLAALDPDGAAVPAGGVDFSGAPPFTGFNNDGSVSQQLATIQTGYVYLQQATRGYSYAVQVSSLTGGTNLWRWDGDNENAVNLAITTWTEMR